LFLILAPLFVRQHSTVVARHLLASLTVTNTLLASQPRKGGEAGDKLLTRSVTPHCPLKKIRSCYYDVDKLGDITTGSEI